MRTNPLEGGRLVAFVGTSQADRARQFYETVLALDLVSEDDFALVFDSAGTRIRVAKVEKVEPQPFTVLGWMVSDVDAAVDALASRGVTFERYPGMDQDERGTWRPPGGGSVAWFRDPDGNLLSVSGPP
jgi:catechol 2,3-dioxygenase-like lactoylglutathione lyase family enzyme